MIRALLLQEEETKVDVEEHLMYPSYAAAVAAAPATPSGSNKSSTHVTVRFMRLKSSSQP